MNIGEFYDGRIESATIDERNGYLRLNIKVVVEGETRFDTIFLTARDGSLRTKILDHVRTWAKGWDGSDPFDLPNCIAGLDVRVKIGEREYNGKTYPDDGFFAMNANGGGATATTEAQKDELRAKYGAKFRAYSGATPKPVATAPAKTAPTPPPPPKDAHRYTMDEAFDAFTSTLDHPYNNGSEDNEAWFALLDSVREGFSDNQTDATSDDWRAVVEKCRRS